MAGGGAADHLLMDAPGSELQVIGEFEVPLFGDTNNFFPFAARASAALDLYLLGYGGLRPLPPSAATPARPSYHFTSTEVDLFSLVIEPGTAINVVEVL
jgi:hypothetical protein